MSKTDNDAGNAIAGGNSAAGPGSDNDAAGGIDGNEGTANGVAGNDGEPVQRNAETTAETPAEKRRGGWPKGKPRKPRDANSGTADTSRNTNTRNAERMDREKVGVLAMQVMSFHQIAAMATGFAELQLSEMEAGLLAQSISDLSKHYGPIISGPGMLWVSFAGVAAMIYVPRAQAIGTRIKGMRRAKQADNADPTNVVEGDFTRKDAMAGDPFKPGNIG